jgi:hypothetical protein
MVPSFLSHLFGALLVALPVGGGLFHSQQQGGVAHQTALYDAPPASMDQLWNESRLVARVRVIRADPHEIQSSKGHGPLLATLHTATVLEAFKGDTEAGQQIRIIVPVRAPGPPGGGSRDVGTSAGLRPFHPNEELLVFLEFWTGAGGYGLAYGSVGAYWLDRPTVTLPAGARTWPVFSGRTEVPREQLLVQVRQLRDKAKGHN